VASTVVVDLLEQCAAMGDLHHALDAGAMTPERVHAELADVVSGRNLACAGFNSLGPKSPNVVRSMS
jgi:ornithine cyclodeaminase/alanine dehydrogenase-like protein (mu-crystallin family)